ncbi:Glutaredoxin, partial [Cynara cardunculus var. scolymus]
WWRGGVVRKLSGSRSIFADLVLTSKVEPTTSKSPQDQCRKMARSAAVSSIFIILLMITAIVMCDAEASSVDFVKKTVSSHSIVIFSKSYCPYCKRAKGVFKELNKKPYVIELDEREDGWKIQDALSELVGRRTVPQVFINGKHLGGSDDTIEAYESGQLAKLLGIDSGHKTDL